jgi:hypothetical protein
MDLEAVNRLITDFEAKFAGWTIHVTNKEIDKSPQADEYWEGLTYVVMRYPSGEDFHLNGFTPDEDDEKFTIQIRKGVEEAIQRFYKDLDETRYLHFSAELTPLLSTNEGLDISIQLTEGWKESKTPPLDAYVIEPRLRPIVVIHCFGAEKLTESGLRKLEAALSTTLLERINSTPIFLYIVNRGTRLPKLVVSFDRKLRAAQEN